MEKMEIFFSLKNPGLRWIKNNTLEFLSILSIIVLSAYLRLFKISQYMTFLGDEGRDVLIARDILHGDFTLLGPRSSAADFFYGPVYYYFITPFLWLFKMDPVGPAVMVALLGIATVFLLYFVGRKFFGPTAGLLASLLYSISPLVIAYSRSSWNPNPLPFVALLSLYILYRGVVEKSWKKMLFVGFLLGIAMQLQYLAMFLATIIFFYVLISGFINKNKLKKFVVYYFCIGVGFLVGFSPFLAFELRHNFPNIRAILGFIFASASGDVPSEAGVEQMGFIARILDVLFRVFARLVFRFPPPEQVSIAEDPVLRVWQIGIILASIFSIYLIIRQKDKLKSLLIILWFVFGVGLFGFYKDSIYDYHFGFMFTLPFLLIGNLLAKSLLKSILFALFLYVFGIVVIYHLKLNGINAYHIFFVSIPFVLLISRVKLDGWRKFLPLISTISLFLITSINIPGYPFANAANQQKDQVKKISEFVLSKAEGKPFNFALLTLGNSDHAYKYYFAIHEHYPVTIKNETLDPKRTTVTDQLLIVCEDPNCQPLGASLWEVAGFGRAEIAGHWNVSVVQVYKLVRYSGK